MMKTQDLNTKIITKKPESARNCESWVKRLNAEGVEVLTEDISIDITIDRSNGEEAKSEIRLQKSEVKNQDFRLKCDSPRF